MKPKPDKREPMVEVTATPYVPGEPPPPGKLYVRLVTPEHPEGLPCWIDPEDAKRPTQVVRKPLTPELEKRALAIYRKIGIRSLWDQPKGEWLGGFECDQTPAREIAFWERIAQVFVAERKLRPNVPKAQLRELLNGLTLVATNPPEGGYEMALAQQRRLRDLPDFKRAVDALLSRWPNAAPPPLIPDGMGRVVPPRAKNNDLIV